MRAEQRFHRWMGHGLLALVLLLGALDLHVQEAREPLAQAGESLYFPGAAHPGQPVHIEEADPAEQPHCAACLHRLQTSGAHVQPPSSALPAEPTIHLWHAPAPNPFRIARSPSGARAPPIS